MDEEQGTRVVVVAGDPLARAGLGAALEEAGCVVVGLIGDEDVAGGSAALYRPDVVVWDVGWAPGDDAAEALLGTEALDDDGVPVLVLVPDQEYAAAAWDARARGLLMRNATSEALAAAVGAMVQGLVVMDSELASSARFAHIARAPTNQELYEELTPRETEVLQLLADGLTNRTIGQALGISEHTVKFHVNAILGKLGAQSRTEAVVQATRLGLILL